MMCGMESCLTLKMKQNVPVGEFLAQKAWLWPQYAPRMCINMKIMKKTHPGITNGENDQHKTHIVFCPGAVVIIFIVRGSRPVPLVVSRAEPLQLFPVSSSWREKNETDFPKRSLSNLQTQCAACYSQIRWVVREAVATKSSPLK